MTKTTGLLLAAIAAVMCLSLSDQAQAQQTERPTQAPETIRASLDGGSFMLMRSGSYHIVSTIGQTLATTPWHAHLAARAAPERAALSQEAPASFSLAANYPNPFNPQTTIRLEVPDASEVRLVVYDVLGRQVRVLIDGTVPAGVHEAVFEARDLSSGVYLYQLETPKGQFTRTMLLVK